MDDFEEVTSVLRSAMRAPANVRRLNHISDVIFYCSVSERLWALALLNAAQISSLSNTSPNSFEMLTFRGYLF